MLHAERLRAELPILNARRLWRLLNILLLPLKRVREGAVVPGRHHVLDLRVVV